MKPLLIISSLVVGIGLLGAAAPRLENEIHPKQLAENLNVAESNAGVSLLGQFRTSLSSWLWARTDLYLHNGVQLRPMTEAEKQKGVIASSSKDGFDEAQGRFTETTVVPSAEQDFRGVLGDVERATTAYRSMSEHEHTAPRNTLPLYRLMTWIEPTFEEGWSTGAHVMALDPKDGGLSKAMIFLRQGVSENPRTLLLRNDLGFMIARKLGDVTAALKPLEEGRSEVLRRTYLGGREKEVALSIYRWLCLCYRESGDYGLAVARAREGTRMFGDDVVLSRVAVLPPTPSRQFLQSWTQPEPELEPADDHEHDHDHDHDHEHEH